MRVFTASGTAKEMIELSLQVHCTWQEGADQYTDQHQLIVHSTQPFGLEGIWILVASTIRKDRLIQVLDRAGMAGLSDAPVMEFAIGQKVSWEGLYLIAEYPDIGV